MCGWQGPFRLFNLCPLSDRKDETKVTDLLQGQSVIQGPAAAIWDPQHKATFSQSSRDQINIVLSDLFVHCASRQTQLAEKQIDHSEVVC